MIKSILNAWQLAFSNKYCRSSKILTKTTIKADFTTLKPRIYVTIENQVKISKIASLFYLKTDFSRGGGFFYTPFMTEKFPNHSKNPSLILTCSIPA